MDRVSASNLLEMLHTADESQPSRASGFYGQRTSFSIPADRRSGILQSSDPGISEETIITSGLQLVFCWRMPMFRVSFANYRVPFLFLEISIVAILTILNGVLAMSELAVVSSRPARLKVLADQGSRGAAIAIRLGEEPGRFLSTVQIGRASCRERV